MRKLKCSLLLCAAMFALSQCAKKNSPARSSAPADEVAAEKSKFSAEQIARGKTLFDNNCGKCHEFHQPAEFSVHSWDDILPDMSRKARLSADDAALVRAWVITNAKAG